MSDLISRKVVSEALKNYFASMIDKRKYNIDTVDCNADLQKIVTNIDTAFDVDKVIEELEEIKEECRSFEEYEYANGIDRAIAIVKGGSQG